MFEPSEADASLIADGVFVGEQEIYQQWLSFITPTLTEAALHIPDQAEPVYGGRKGYHTEHLQPLLTEMTEVYRIDPSAEW
jgi:ring-1,2-phenylacetyl-CoA epoxidase subunit PaaC